MTISDLKAGQEFLMEGLDVNGNSVTLRAKLISYNGMNKYIIYTEGITMLADGDDKIKGVIK